MSAHAQRSCIVCHKYGPSGNCSLHKFPNNEEFKILWLKAVGRSSVAKSAVICSDHFDDSSFNHPFHCIGRRLRADAVPNIFVPKPGDKRSMTDASPMTRANAVPNILAAKAGDKRSMTDTFPMPRVDTIKIENPETETDYDRLECLESTSHDIEEAEQNKEEEQRTSETDEDIVPAQNSRPNRLKGVNFKREDFKSEAIWKRFRQYRSQRRRDIEATNIRCYQKEKKLKNTIEKLKNKDYFAAAKALEVSRKKPRKTQPPNANISHPFEKIEVLIITRVYLYLQREYEFIKSLTSDNAVLTPLANVIKRTAEATCVTEDTVKTILERQASQKTSAQGDAGVEANNVPLETEVELKDASVSQKEDAMEIDRPAKPTSQPSQPVQHLVTNTACSQLYSAPTTSDSRLPISDSRLLNSDSRLLTSDSIPPISDSRPPSILFLEVCPLIVRSSPDVSRVKSESPPPPPVKSEPADYEYIEVKGEPAKLNVPEFSPDLCHVKTESLPEVKSELVDEGYSPDLCRIKTESPPAVKSEPADEESSPDVCRVKAESLPAVKSELIDEEMDIPEHRTPYTVPTTTGNSNVLFQSYYNNDHNYFDTNLD